ncbi:MAG: hypothetical protein JW776_04415 [Candidatus Lokiarchaeota archaeon]|nr:hypothetical protein [Candidatus Lokiarchaeota archaeon]
MQRHQRSFFGQKVGMIFDSGKWDEDYAYLTFLRKKNDGTWEKPTLKEGKYVKLNLGELILFRKVLDGTSERWSTVHSFNGTKTTISIQKHAQNSGEIWINVDTYGKNLRSPETDILEMLLKHIIKEKIVRATVRKVIDS